MGLNEKYHPKFCVQVYYIHRYITTVQVYHGHSHMILLISIYHISSLVVIILVQITYLPPAPLFPLPLKTPTCIPMYSIFQDRKVYFSCENLSPRLFIKVYKFTDCSFLKKYSAFYMGCCENVLAFFKNPVITIIILRQFLGGGLGIKLN